MSERDTVTDEAVVFVYALDSRYFAEVFTVLGNELQATDPDQAIALDKLHTRLLAMRDLLEKRLRDLAAPEEKNGDPDSGGGDGTLAGTPETLPADR